MSHNIVTVLSIIACVLSLITSILAIVTIVVVYKRTAQRYTSPEVSNYRRSGDDTKYIALYDNDGNGYIAMTHEDGLPCHIMASQSEIAREFSGHYFAAAEAYNSFNRHMRCVVSLDKSLQHINYDHSTLYSKLDKIVTTSDRGNDMFDNCILENIGNPDHHTYYLGYMNHRVHS